MKFYNILLNEENYIIDATSWATKNQNFIKIAVGEIPSDVTHGYWKYENNTLVKDEVKEAEIIAQQETE